MCRYDVNTIKCAPRTNSTTALAPTAPAFTKPADSEGAVAYGRGREEAEADKGILWFSIAIFTVALLVGILLAVVLYIRFVKNQFLPKMLWNMLCLTTNRKYLIKF